MRGIARECVGRESAGTEADASATQALLSCAAAGSLSNVSDVSNGIYKLTEGFWQQCHKNRPNGKKERGRGGGGGELTRVRRAL